MAPAGSIFIAGIVVKPEARPASNRICFTDWPFSPFFCRVRESNVRVLVTLTDAGATIGISILLDRDTYQENVPLESSPLCLDSVLRRASLFELRRDSGERRDWVFDELFPLRPFKS